MITFKDDVLAPGLVTVIDLTSETVAPDWNEWLAYITAVAGYVGSYANYGGDFVKNVGIAAAPWMMKKLYFRVKGMLGVTKSVAMKPGVGRAVSRSYQPEFNKSMAY